MDMAQDIKKLSINLSDVVKIQRKYVDNSNVDDLSLLTKGERNAFGEIIGPFAELAETCFIELKTRINTLLAINRLPIEILTYIIFLTHSSQTTDKHPYISYTWVCRHWRTVIIHNAQFWTFIQLKQRRQSIDPFVHKLIKRSKSAKLDVKLSFNSSRSLPILEKFFAQESHRIRTIWFESHHKAVVRTLFSDKTFPSLKGLVQHVGSSWNNSFIGLLPGISTWDHLETLECNLWWEAVPMVISDRLKLVFARIRKLSIRISTSDVLLSVLDTLQENHNLRSLNIKLYGLAAREELLGQTIFPELQFLSTNVPRLLEHVQVPKLLGLDIESNTLISFSNPVFKDFDFSPFKYFHVLDRHAKKGPRRVESVSILALKKPIHPDYALFSIKPKETHEEYDFVKVVDDIVDVKDILSDACPSDYFRLKFVLDDGDDENRIVEPAVFSTLSRLTGLSEICLMSNILIQTTLESGVLFNEIFSPIKSPSLEKLIVSYGQDTIDFIQRFTDPSFLPQLKLLSYTDFWSDMLPEHLEEIGEDVGKLLIKCIQSRHNAHGNILNYIFLGSCPPPPNASLNELEMLGVTVTTEDIETIRTRCQHHDDYFDSDSASDTNSED